MIIIIISFACSFSYFQLLPPPLEILCVSRGYLILYLVWAEFLRFRSFLSIFQNKDPNNSPPS